MPSLRVFVSFRCVVCSLLLWALFFPPDIVRAVTVDTADRLNFVVILVDDLGWADLSCYGSTFFETPHLDRMAADGIRFTNGYAACAVCSPTRTSLQTGLYPARTHVTDWIRAEFQGGTIPSDGKNPTEYIKRPNWELACPPNGLFLELEYLTIAEYLKSAGYVTGHIGKWHLGQESHFPEHQGYDSNFAGCDLGQPPSYFDPYTSNNPKYIFPSEVASPRQKGEYLTDRESAEAVRFIEVNKDRPFFLHLAHYAVHTPLQGKAELVDKYREKNRQREHDATEQTSRQNNVQNNAVYAAMVQSVDESTGTILAAIDRLGLTGKTVILFTSDNGGLLGPTNNSPLRSGKGYPYEGGIRVPWIVRCPGVIPSGQVSAEPVITCDIFPTLADFATAAVKTPISTRSPSTIAVDGESLRPILLGKSAEFTGKGRPLFWHYPHYRFENNPAELPPYSIIQEDGWKLIKFYHSGGPKYELYHLAADLAETKELSVAASERVEEMNDTLEKWLNTTGARLPRP